MASSTKNHQNNQLTFFIHIGDMKTGTSAIQNFLDVNRSTLFKNHACLYPNFHALALDQGRCHNHGHWYTDNEDNPHNLKTDIEKLVGFCRKQQVKTVVLSYEGWSGYSKVRLSDVFQEMKENDPQLAVKLICYVRRMDHWSESFWKQWGMKKHKTINSFANFRAKKGREVLLQVLKDWEAVIGRDNMIIRPYEKEQLKNGLVADFLGLIGIDFSAYTWTPPEQTNLAMNRGFNRDVLEIQHLCQDLTESVHDNRLFKLFFNLLGSKFLKEPFESYQLFSPGQRLAILKKNQPIMEEIARRYLGREDGKMFNEPWPDEDEIWEEYQGLTLEKLVPILIQMIYSQRQAIRALTGGKSQGSS